MSRLNDIEFFGYCRGKIMELHENCLMRFLIVGALGTVVNLAIFFLFADILNVDTNISSIIAFLIVVTQNYVLNHVWSFKKLVNFQINGKSYMHYVFLNIFGLGINLVVLNIILFTFNPEIKTIAQLSGVLSGTFFNFILSRSYVFQKKP